MPLTIRKIAVVGAGAWGTALCLVALRAGAEVIVWAHDSQIADAINLRRVNPYLPRVELDPRLRATADPVDLRGVDAVLLAPPAQHLREVCRRIAAYVGGAPVAICAKGIEAKTGKLLSTVVSDEIPSAPLAVLTGPTFAPEVAKGLPTAVTLACADRALGTAIAAALGAPTFRPYHSTDVVGAQIGGAVKNVLAIACGIVTGRELGDNARAALVTRGMTEVLRLGRALGAEPATLLGLSGFGDLVLTCTSAQSRNMSLGVRLGRGEPLESILAERTSVTEGVATAAAVAGLSEKLCVDMPISGAVHDVVNRGVNIDSVIRGLLERPIRPEDQEPLGPS